MRWLVFVISVIWAGILVSLVVLESFDVLYNKHHLYQLWKIHLKSQYLKKNNEIYNIAEYNITCFVEWS